MRKLLTLAAAMLVAVGAQAQKDVTSQYITNATLSNGTNGWTKTFSKTKQTNDPADAFSNSVRGNNTIGYASEAYAGWGELIQTEYSMKQDITLPAGHYTLVSYSFFRQGEGYNTNPTKSLAYLKAGGDKVALKTLGSITAAGYANSQADGANCFDSKMYRNTLDFTIDADNTTITIGVEGTFDEMRSWCIVGAFELIDNDQVATMDSPFDVTGYITNPGFEYRDMTGWTLSESGAFGTQNNSQSFKVGGYYAEKWQSATSGALSARSMSQTIKNLPAGYYKLTANLGGDGTYVDLNGKTANWTADKDYTVGYVLAENEDLTITAGKTAEGSANWIHFDNFKLYFCGDVQAALTTLLAQVSDYDGVIPAAAYSALLTNVAAYDNSYSDVDELLAAISAVQELYSAADALKAPYTAWLAMKSQAQTLAAVENDNDEANATLSEAISTQNTAAEAATAAAGLTDAAAALKTAMTTYVFAANPVGDGAQFDCTFLMTNPDLTGLPTWAKCEGWTSEETDGNYQVMVNDSKTQGDKSYFYEYWSNPAKASGKFALYNAVTLPVGTFTMSCYAFAEDQYTGSTVDGVYFYANETQGSCVTATVLTQQTLSFVNGEEQEVKIGLKTLTGNTRNWMGIGYVELYKVPANAVTIDETVDFVAEDIAADVTLNRTIKANVWNSFVVPFTITNAELKAAFGDDVEVAEFTGETPNGSDATSCTVNFTKMATPAVTPNKPVLLKTSTAGTTYDFEGRTIVPGTPQVAGTLYNFVGSYAATTTVAEGDYFFSGDKLWQSEGASIIKGTRAYLKANSAEARIAGFVVDDEQVTAIEGLTVENTQNGAIYNLNGQRVDTPKKGLYIREGKKFVVK